MTVVMAAQHHNFLGELISRQFSDDIPGGCGGKHIGGDQSDFYGPMPLAQALDESPIFFCDRNPWDQRSLASMTDSTSRRAVPRV